MQDIVSFFITATISFILLVSNGLRKGTNGFKAFYYTFLVQLAAYIIVAITVLLVRLIKNFRRAKRKPEEQYNWWEWFVMGLRIIVSSCFAGPATLYGVKALMLYSNLPVLAMLPVRIFQQD
jgi:amino acid transporter